VVKGQKDLHFQTTNPKIHERVQEVIATLAPQV